MSWRTNGSHVVSQGPCTNCKSSDAKTHYSDGHAYCFSCATYFPSEHRPSMTPPYDTPKPKSDVYPQRLPVDRDHCGVNYDFLKKYGLTDEEISEYYFYAPLSQRHVFSFLDPTTGAEFFEARTHSPDVRPKSMQHGHKPTMIIGDMTSEYLVIVEDVVSAIKVGRQAKAMPLFGSYMTQQAMADVGRDPTIKQCIIWMDCDKYAAGMHFARLLGAVKPTVAIQTLQDPKDLPDDAITVALESALDSLEAVCEAN